MADITSQEYQQYMALREQINTGIENADSEFMLTTYSMLRTVMNRRQKAALQLNIQLENQAIREKKEAKRKQLRNSKTSQSGTSQRTAPSTPRT
jgi:ABC-type lipoprotein release transport system permease subunit